MSESFLERMSRFTPDAGGLDRDALLFAAGRGSVRPNRGWITAAALLANTQILSLVLLWPPSMPRESGLSVATAVAPISLPPATGESRTAEPPANPGTWSTRQKLREPQSDDFAYEAITLIDTGPPLRVFGPLPPSLLN
jgi:hypothetical protein